MSRVWISSVLSNYDIGNKQGLRSKFYRHNWQPEAFEIPAEPDEIREAGNRYTRGLSLKREDFPQAAAVWDGKSFSKVKDLFTAGGFYCVKGLLADVLSRFNLGQGGLIPFPIYQADLATTYPGEFFLLNFGCIKNTILPEQSQNVVKFAIDKDTKQQIWKVNLWHEDGDVALSPAALEGADLWFEELVDNKIFMSDALGQALIDIGMGEVFRLTRCRIA